MTIFLASVGFGLVTSSVLAIAAIGFTLQFGVTDVLNLAYGAVMIAGAFLAYLLNSHGVNVWIGLAVAVAACSAGSVLLNAGVYAPFQRRGTAPITMVIVSLGMTLIIEFGVQALAGGTSVSYAMSNGPTVSAGGFTLTAVQFAVIGLSVLVMAGTHVLLRHTKLGKAMRATAANQTLARNCGIRTGRVIAATWAITGGMCGLAGVVFAMDAGSFNATSTDLFLVLILAATFLGGPGQAYGAMLGAVVIGLATEVSAAYITPSYKYVVAFAALLLMLGVRPAGLLGEGGLMNSYYVINLLIYAAVDAMACLGLSQQFGVAGVTNFGFIIFQAAGGYTAAILALPRDSASGGFQSYLGGWNLPFPIPWIGAAIVGGLIALPFTFLVGRRLRGDFAAVGLLVTAVLLNLLVTNYRPLLDGDAGLSLIPQPLQGEYNPQTSRYQWALAAVAIVACAAVYLFVRRITESPYGRSLRAMRDNDAVADSLGKNLLSLRTAMLVTGGAIAGLSGAILVSYITTWSPAAWGYAETVVLFAAVIIGGAGNHAGAILGAILVPVGFEEVTRYIPASNNLPPNLIPSLQWVAIGLLIVTFLWVRPQGILPERKRMARAAPIPAAASDETASDETASDETASDETASDDTAPGETAPGETAPTARIAPRGDGAQPSAEPAPSKPHDHEVVLQAVDVVREFGGLRAVAGVTVSVRRGTLTGLIGPNGAGKSTLLAMLAGTLPVTSGQICYQGADVTSLPAYRRARLGLIRTFQLASEFKRLTVMENLLSAVPGNRGDSLRGALAGPRYWRADEDAAITRATALLEQFGLQAHAGSYAGDLSGGQRRMVEIMRALMAEPRVLLLDEPMAGVHPRLARKIGGELVALAAGGLTVLMVEHELAIMDEFCDPVVAMVEGAVLAQGTMSELRLRSDVVEAYLVG